MKTDIRAYIINNFKDTNIEQIKESIVASINEKDEITLPGLGVFFELIWNNSDDNEKTNILNSIKKGL